MIESSLQSSINFKCLNGLETEMCEKHCLRPITVPLIGQNYCAARLPHPCAGGEDAVRLP